MNEAVLLEIVGPIAWITLNRPQALNAINMDMRAALPAAIRAAEADEAVRVLVLRGAGERAFCAGADIKEFAEVASPVTYRQSRVHDNWTQASDQARKPILASIQGACLGGGLEMAVACDIRIAAETAVFGFPETGLGIIPGAGGTQRLPRLIGSGAAMDMILTGERISARQARELGLVTRVVPAAELSAVTEELAARIAARPPMAMAFAKEAVRAASDLPLREGLRLEADMSTLLMNTEDRLEAAQAFRDKRAPRFTGR